MKFDNDTAVICGFPICTNVLDHNYQLIIEGLRERRGRWVVTLNLEMIYRSHVNKYYKDLLHEADLYVADGVPLIWASGYKKNTPQIAGRSNGTDLVEKLLAPGNDFRIGVIGGTDPASTVKKYNPGLLKNAYFYDGKVDIQDEKLIALLIDHLKKNKTNLLFLSLGVPKQDKLALKIRKHIQEITVIGVGGSFDLLGGHKSRAPKWMQKNGLEWLFRLLTEPLRLAKRYLIHYPQAVYFLIKDIF